MSLKKRLFSNGIASVLQKGVRVLEQLFLVPFFITAWGATYYGEWITLTIIPSVIAFSNLGFGTAAANGFVLSYAMGNKQEAADISKTGMDIITLMISIGMLISFIVLWILDSFNIFDKSLIEKQEAILAVSILILSSLFSFYNQMSEAYFRAAQKAALSINLLTIKSALSLGGGLLVLLLGYGIVPFALSQLVVSIVFNIFYWFKGRKLLDFFNEFNGRRNALMVKTITKKGLGYLTYPAWQAIYFQGTTFAVRIVLGPEAVAVFNTVRTLSRSVNQLLNIISSSIFPELQFELGQGNLEKAQKIYRFSIITSFVIATAGALFLALFGLWFYNIWTQNELDVPALMWYIFVVSILFNAFWWSAEPVFRAKNEPHKFAKAGILSAVISVLLTYVFSSFFGLIGSALGALALDVILAFWIIPLSVKMLDMNIGDIYSSGITDISQMYNGLKKKYKFL